MKISYLCALALTLTSCGFRLLDEGTSAQLAAEGPGSAFPPLPERPPLQPTLLSAATHFVAPSGSATSLCTQAQPCTLTRAASLTGTANMPAGSVVLLRTGIYSENTLNFNGSGKPDQYIKFVGESGVRITGSRVEPPAASWTLTAGRTYTYEIFWDQFSPEPVQRPPVAGWRPIWVEDRVPPYTARSARRFDLYFPPNYSSRSSVDEVEAQSGTYYYDGTNRRLYVHLFDGSRPTDDKNVFLKSGKWGNLEIRGDYLWFENLTIEHSKLTVMGTAHSTAIKNVKALASQVLLQGAYTLAEDIDVSHVIYQRTDTQECVYDVNPDFGVGECWHANAFGNALIIGDQDNANSSHQIVRRARVHRAWNGAYVYGHNVLEHSTFWGFPNHTLQVKGSGGYIRHNTFLNGQDSIYCERDAFDALTVENNLIAHGSLFQVSNNGMGGTALSVGWRFRNNIATALAVDDITMRSLTSDCNLFIPTSANASFLFKVQGTNGRSSFEYDSLNQLQANTSFEDNSRVLATTKWFDGTQFRNYSGQFQTDFDFTPVNGALSRDVCGGPIGPTTFLNVANQ